MILKYLFAPLHAVTFGLLDKRAARRYERQLAGDVRLALGGLFRQYHARIVPNYLRPPAYDVAYVTIALDDLLLLFVRGRGEFAVHLSSAAAPASWHDLSLVLCVVSGQDEIRRATFRDVTEFAGALQPHILALLQLENPERFAELQQRLERDFYQHERVRIQQAESALNLWLYKHR